MKKRILVLCSQPDALEAYQLCFKVVVNPLEAEVDFIGEDLSEKGVKQPLPRGYDSYILHPSDLMFEDLKLLRQEQPKSWIHFLHRIWDQLGTEEKEICDNAYFGFGMKGAKEVLEYAQLPRLK